MTIGSSARLPLALGALLLALHVVPGLGMWIMLPHWDYHHPSHLYSHVPYGRFNYFPDAYKYMPHDRHPLYYDPRDPYGLMPNPATFNFTDPYRGAGYLPREAMGMHNALHPSFGFIPVNYVPPNYHPTWPGGKFNYPTRFSHAEGFHDLVPFDVPIPGWHAGNNHPLYAPWYHPGIAKRRADRDRTLLNGELADFPAPVSQYRVDRPLYFDRPSAWPSMGPNDPYAVVPHAPPPPPEAGSPGGADGVPPPA